MRRQFEFIDKILDRQFRDEGSNRRQIIVVVPGNADLVAVLLRDFPHLSGVIVDLEQPLSDWQHHAGPLLVLAGRSDPISRDIVNACGPRLRRADDETLIQPRKRLDLSRRRVGRRIEDDLRSLFFQPPPLGMPVDVKTDLYPNRPKVSLKYRRVDSTGTDGFLRSTRTS